MIRILGTAAALAAGLLAAGCGSAPAPAAGPAPSPTAAPSSSPAPPPQRLSWGQTARWPTGDTITVAAPREHTETTETVSGAQLATRYVVLDVAVHNGGGAAQRVAGYVYRLASDGTPVDEASTHDLTNTERGGYLAPGTDRTLSIAVKRERVGQALELQLFGEGHDPSRPVVFFTGPAPAAPAPPPAPPTTRPAPPAAPPVAPAAPVAPCPAYQGPQCGSAEHDQWADQGGH